MNSSGLPVFTAVFIAVLVALGSGFLVVQRYTPPAPATAPVTPEVRQFTLHLQVTEAKENATRHWMPPVIMVNAGDTVILRITNDDEGAHGFSLGALNVTVPSIAPGETVTVRFKATRPGIYHYGCALAGCALDHAYQTGQLVVLSGR